MRLNSFTLSGRFFIPMGPEHRTNMARTLPPVSFPTAPFRFFRKNLNGGKDFAHELLPSLWSWQPDLTLNGYANEQVLNQSLMDRICSVSGVEQGELSEIYGDSNKVMTVSNKDNPFKVGDTVRIGGQEVEIVGALSDGVYSSEYSVICSQETFSRLTGKKNYSILELRGVYQQSCLSLSLRLTWLRLFLPFILRQSRFAVCRLL